MQASKNGFIYVLDRDTGRLISAEKFAKVTWAKGIDVATGRPIENDNARYQSGQMTIWPGPIGAHGPQAMAFSPITELAYFPVLDLAFTYVDRGLDLKAWRPARELVPNFGLNFNMDSTTTVTPPGESYLVAWDPRRQRAAWKVPLPGLWNGGVMASAGNLVFEGRYDGKFCAYAADTGRLLWSFDAQVGIVGAPITYRVADRQYVSVLAGYGGTGTALGAKWDARTERRRVLTFSLDGAASLPPPPAPHYASALVDPSFTPDAASESKGALVFNNRCASCHGFGAVAGGSAPDLRESSAVLSPKSFQAIVQQGSLMSIGMPRFEELKNSELHDMRQYLRARSASLRSSP
jgi:quinohemoprotein ethanol dehydrogenase